jgi:hypothetical protein
MFVFGVRLVIRLPGKAAKQDCGQIKGKYGINFQNGNAQGKAGQGILKCLELSQIGERDLEG